MGLSVQDTFNDLNEAIDEFGMSVMTVMFTQGREGMTDLEGSVAKLRRILAKLNMLPQEHIDGVKDLLKESGADVELKILLQESAGMTEDDMNQIENAHVTDDMSPQQRMNAFLMMATHINIKIAKILT
ncbi:MAG: hypothetical protein VX730_08675 [Pseudomonadota bacterium]|nr:hypothetical protein [Pseudomonadota bacterium]